MNVLEPSSSEIAGQPQRAGDVHEDAEEPSSSEIAGQPQLRVLADRNGRSLAVQKSQANRNKRVCVTPD